MIITVLSENEIKQLYEVFPQSILEDSDLCIGALNGSEITGLLSAKRVLKECWDITFLHVDDSWRRHHVADDMLKLLYQTVSRLGAGAVTANFVREGSADALYNFAVRKGFETVSESGVLKSTLSAVSIAIEGLRKIKSFSGVILPLNKATESQWNALTGILEEKRSEQDKKRGENSGMLYIVPEPKNYYKADISVLALDKKGVPAGALLMREGDDFISVDYLVSLIAKDPNLVINLMKEVCSAMEEKYHDIDIHFHTYNPTAEKLARTLLGRYAKDVGCAVYMIKYL